VTNAYLSLKRRATRVLFSLFFVGVFASPAVAQPAPSDAAPKPVTPTVSSTPATPSVVEPPRDSVEKRLADAERSISELRSALEESERRRALDEERRQSELKALRAEEDLRRKYELSVRSKYAGVKLSGFVHMDTVAYNHASKDDVDGNGEPLNETRFLLRRARIRLDADYRWLFGSFEIDANTNKGLQVRPQSFDVGVRYKNPKSDLPFIALHVGLVRTPFGFEVQQSDKDRLFLERATMASAFFPGEFDLGVRAYGGWRFLRYAVAAMNGDPIGEKAFPGRDPAQSKDFVANAGVDFKAGRVRFAVNASGLYGHGFHKAVTATMPMSPSATFGRFAVGGDLQLAVQLPKVGELKLMAEATYATNLDRGVALADPVAAGHDLKELGYYVGFTQELTRWAIVGVRWDQYAPDMDTLGFNDGTYSTVTTAVGARLAGYGRVILQHLHQTNNTGRNMDGSIKTSVNDVLTLRAEILF
jgi:hypothetical protein